MTCHLINKAVIKQNCIEVFNLHAIIIIIIILPSVGYDPRDDIIIIIIIIIDTCSELSDRVRCGACSHSVQSKS